MKTVKTIDIIEDYFLNNKDKDYVRWDDFIKYAFEKQKNETGNIYYEFTDEAIYNAIYWHRNTLCLEDETIFKLPLDKNK